MPTPTLVALDNLKQALAIAEQIQKLEAELKSVLAGSPAAPAPAATRSTPIKIRGMKRTLSPETIAKMRAAQQARWAKKPETTAKPAAVPKKKKGITPEGRAKLAAAMKARWAAKKKAAK